MPCPGPPPPPYADGPYLYGLPDRRNPQSGWPILLCRPVPLAGAEGVYAVFTPVDTARTRQMAERRVAALNRRYRAEGAPPLP